MMELFAFGTGSSVISKLARFYGFYEWAERRHFLVLLLSFSALLSGCSPFVDRDQMVVASGITLKWEAGHTIGQTFVARHGGLSGIEIYLKPGSGESALILHLRESPLHQVDLRTAQITLPPGSPEGFYRFSFSPIRNSHTRYYYAFLEQKETGQIIIPAAGLETYADGTLYYDHKPQAYQAAFRLVYDPIYITLDLLLAIISWIIYGIIVLQILFLSGYGLVRGWCNEKGLDFTSTLILSAASALGFWMVILVWVDVLGIRFNRTSVRLIAAASVLMGLAYWIRDRHFWRRRTYWLGEDLWATLAVWIAVLAALGLRLFVGRGMVMLPGSDTYHHTLIVQLFEEQGGIPRSYEPYAPLLSFSYHFGFHSIVALFRWLFETDLLSTTKVVALVLNGAIAATAGFASESLTRSRWSNVITSVLVGLVMVSPFALLRWGRFTQTTGMFFLPLGVLIALTGRELSNRIWPIFIIVGMGLSHTRVTFFWLLLVMLVFFRQIWINGWSEVKPWVRMGGISLALALPWLLRVIWVHWDPQDMRITYSILNGSNDLRRLEEIILSFPTNWPLVVVALGLAMVALWTGHTVEVRVLSGWILFLMGGVAVFSKVRQSFWDIPTTALSISIPLAMLVCISGRAIERILLEKIRSVSWVVLAVGLGLGALIGAWRLPDLVYTGLFYLRPGDLTIMKWIQENIPEDALFLVNAIEFDWSPGWMVGIDAGYWIPLLAHRSTVLPPMLYPLEWASHTVSQNTRILREYLKISRENSGEICKNFKELKTTHIFWTNPSFYFGRECLEILYKQDRISILKILK
jgi:hypothetical protein